VIQVNKKTIYIIVAILAVVIVAVAAAALLMTNEEENPAPEVSIADATSLKFTAASHDVTYVCSIKNVNKEDQVLRIDMTVEGETYNYVINQADKTSFMSMDATEWFESTYDEDFETYVILMAMIVDDLGKNCEDASTNYNYPADAAEAEYVISSISVNPSLNDSIFNPTSPR